MASSHAQSVSSELTESLKKLDAGSQPKGSDEAKALAENLSRSLRAVRDKINERDVQAWRAIKTKADWEQFRDQKLTYLARSLYAPRLGPTATIHDYRKAYFATPDQPPKTHVTKTLPGEGFVVENLVYESPLPGPGRWVTANLYRPEPLPNKTMPGILLIHSHHNPKTQGELQDMGMIWARAGCYVLVPDMPGHGERRDHPFHTAKDYDKEYAVSRQDYQFRYNLGMQLRYTGDSLIGWMAWDLKHGLDVLLHRPKIDKEKIVVMGAVAGGGDPSGVFAALDTRVKALVPFNFGGPQPETRFPLPDDAELSFNYVGGGSWETTRNLLYSGRDGFAPWVIVGSVAPRALIHAHEFAWDAQRDPVWKRYQRIFGEFYQAADRLGVAYGAGSVRGRPPESTHCNNIGAVHRKPIYSYLEKWFGIPSPPEEYSKRFESSELHCWTPELRAKLNPKKLYELATEAVVKDATQLKSSPVGLPAFEEKYQVTEKNGPEIPGVQSKLIDVAGTEAGFKTTALLLIPKQEPKTPNVVIAFAKRGRQAFLLHRAETIAALLTGGARVCLVDLVATGELSPGSSVGRASELTGLASLADVVGLSVSRLQGEGLKAILDHFQGTAQKPGWLRGKPVFWHDSFASVNSPDADLKVPHNVDSKLTTAEPVHAPAILNQIGRVNGDLYLRGGWSDTGSLLRSPFVHLPYDAVTELGYGTNLNLWTLTAKGQVKLEGLVDAQNRAIKAREEISTPKELAEWFLSRLKQ
jgi:dienelactone hydrolase